MKRVIFMEIRKRMIPNSNDGKPIEWTKEREYIFFKVKFNKFRDVSYSSKNEILDKEEPEECECVLTLPDSYSDDGEQTPLIISCHGAGSNVAEAENKIGGLNLVTRCVEAGYAALDVSGSVKNGLSMGCPEHIFALYKAYRYAIKHYNLTDRVLLSGASMGGQTALNFAHMYPSVVLCVGIFFPRLNIDGVTVNGHYCIGTWDKTERRNNGSSTRDKIINIYRFPTEEWYEPNTVGSNPYRLRSFINSDGERVVIPPCPIKIWQGTADAVTDPVMAKEFYDSIRRSGSYAELHLLDGVSHNVTDVMREEQLLWFNRFI